MFSYLTGEDILFSNDAFGQHYATESLPAGVPHAVAADGRFKMLLMVVFPQ